jgi:DNA-binding response OmpR family regulator
MSMEILACSFVLDPDTGYRAMRLRPARPSKPIGPFRPSGTAGAPGTARFGGWTVDLAERRLIRDGLKGGPLSDAEFTLLMAFLDEPRRTLTRERLAAKTRGRAVDASPRTLDVYVSRLRRRLRARDATTELIGTVRGQGYVLNADVVFGARKGTPPRSPGAARLM